MGNIIICAVCNKTITRGDFCDDLQCPQPARDATEGKITREMQIPKFDYCCHQIERKDCEQCSRDTTPPKPVPDVVREGDDLDRPLFFEPGGDGMAACIHDADGYIFCEVTYDEFKDNPSFPERVIERLVKRASTTPAPPANAMRTALEVAKVGFQNITPASLTDADICKVAIAKIDWALSQAPVKGDREAIVKILEKYDRPRLHHAEIADAILSLPVPPGAWPKTFDCAPRDGSWIIARCNDHSEMYKLRFNGEHWDCPEASTTFGGGLFLPNGDWIPDFFSRQAPHSSSEGGRCDQ